MILIPKWHVVVAESFMKSWPDLRNSLPKFKIIIVGDDELDYADMLVTNNCALIVKNAQTFNSTVPMDASNEQKITKMSSKKGISKFLVLFAANRNFENGTRIQNKLSLDFGINVMLIPQSVTINEIICQLVNKYHSYCHYSNYNTMRSASEVTENDNNYANKNSRIVKALLCIPTIGRKKANDILKLCQGGDLTFILSDDAKVKLSELVGDKSTQEIYKLMKYDLNTFRP